MVLHMNVSAPRLDRPKGDDARDKACDKSPDKSVDDHKLSG
jgi:hypothetical protein